MGNFRRDAQRLIANFFGLTKIVVKFGLPPIELTFEKSAFEAMLKSKNRISRIVMLCFADRPIMWTNPTQFDPDQAINNLRRIETDIYEADGDLSNSPDMGAVQYAGIIRPCVIYVADARRKIEAVTIPEFRKQKMVEALTGLHVAVLPRIQLLVDLLDETDSIHAMAIQSIQTARNNLTPEQIAALELHIEQGR